MKKVVLIVTAILLMFGYKTFGQTDIALTTHWYNRVNYNPASIVREGYIYFFSNIQKQWVGIEGSPTVYNFQASGYSERSKSAIGISLTRDEIGVTAATNPMFQYAYKVELNENLNLALGVSAGIYSRKVNGSVYEAETVFDPILDYSDEKYTSPDADVGAELQGQHFMAGISLTHLFSIWKAEDLFLISNHRYAYALYKNSESELYNITAGIQVANRKNLTIIEGTAIVRFKRPTGLIKGPTELFDFGFSIRSVKQLTLISGINVTPNMRIGYTYDFDFSNNVNESGTHEIILEYRIPLIIKEDTGLKWYD